MSSPRTMIWMGSTLALDLSGGQISTMKLAAPKIIVPAKYQLASGVASANVKYASRQVNDAPASPQTEFAHMQVPLTLLFLWREYRSQNWYQLQDNRHCEERSDEAISLFRRMVGGRLRRSA